RFATRRSEAIGPCEVFLQRQAVRVAPLTADDERHGAADRQRAPHLSVRQNALLHPPGIEEDREPRVIRTPELVVERQDGTFDLTVVVVEQPDVLDAALMP